MEGAADFVGEEQEQIFAIQGRRAATTKHMSLSGETLTFLFYMYDKII